jgi:hypothetical protein
MHHIMDDGDVAVFYIFNRIELGGRLYASHNG